MFQRWTNGKFRSTSYSACKWKGEILYPFFFEPDFDAVVECLEMCHGKYGPKYPPITAGSHLLSMYEDYDGKKREDQLH
ncbi:LOW QUALITY PROTEIN: hypothetical protein ACHAW6_000016 [Cyclotella cf. meneghiniana]